MRPSSPASVHPRVHRRDQLVFLGLLHESGLLSHFLHQPCLCLCRAREPHECWPIFIRSLLLCRDDIGHDDAKVFSADLVVLLVLVNSTPLVSLVSLVSILLGNLGEG